MRSRLRQGTAGVMPLFLETLFLAKMRPAGHIATGQVLRSYGRTRLHSTVVTGEYNNWPLFRSPPGQVELAIH